MIPRLAWPLTLQDGSLRTVEQDSDEDITQCVKAILLHRVEDRTDLPELGVPDLTFGEAPADVDGLLEVVGRHEPRVTASARAQVVDQLTTEITLTTARAEEPPDG